MSAAVEPPAYCSPQELVLKGYQPVFCTPNQSGIHTPLSGTTGGRVGWPVHAPEPGSPYRLALRPPPDVLIVDVDDHDGLATGPRTLAAMEAELGPLPPTWRLSARGPTDPAGRRLYRIPADLIVTDALFKAFGGDIEAVRTGWRFSWAPGDINPKTGTPVVVYGPDGQPTELPPVAMLPQWPEQWVRRFRTAPQPVAAAPPPAASATDRFMQDTPPARLSAAREAISRKLAQVAGHQGSGFRNLLSGAALMMAGYAAGAPQYFDTEQLTEALYDAVGRRWGSVDDEDQRWIEEGWYDGTHKHAPLRVYDETQRLPDNVVQMPGVQGQVMDSHDPLSWLRSKLVTAAGLKALPPPEPLVNRILYADTLAWLIGAPGHGKSFVAVDLACSIATGTPWQGHPVQQGPVLYLVAEGVTGAGQRVEAWERHHGRPADGVYFLPYPLQLGEGAPFVEAFQALVAELQPRMVVVDTQARTSVGVDENSAKDVGVLIGNLDTIRAACAWTTVLVIHHTPRGSSTPRGSTSIEGAADTILLATKDGLLVTLKVTKQKDAPEAPDLTLTMKPSGDSVVLTSQTSSAAEPGIPEPAMVLHNHLLTRGGQWTYSGIFQDFGIARQSAARYLSLLEDAGLVIADRESPNLHKFRARRQNVQILPQSVDIQPWAPVGHPPEPEKGAERKSVDILPENVDIQPSAAQNGFGHPAHDAQAAQAAHEVLKHKLAGQSGVPTGAHVPAQAEAKLPTGEGSLDPPRAEAVSGWAGGMEGSRPSVTESDIPAGPQSSEETLPIDAPAPPKKRAEPKPGTKAYERAQAKAAEKAERFALAAGGSVQYPAVVLRDGQVLETTLEAAEELLSGLPELTVDVESSGVPIGHTAYELRLVQIGNEHFAVDLDPKDPEQMALASRALKAAPVLHAHSSTADVVPLALADLDDFDSMMERMDDTAIRAKLHDPQSTGSDAGLKRISEFMLGGESASTPAEAGRAELFGAGGWLSEPKATTPLERNGWHQVDPRCKTFARYGGADVLDTALIAQRLPPLPPHIAERENTVAHMVSRIALKGIKLNGALVSDLMTEHVMKRDEWAKAIQSWTSIDNVGSDKQVAQALLGLGVRLPYTKPSGRFPEGQPSVAAGVLETLQGELEGTEHPAYTLIEQVLTWRHHDTAVTLFLTPYSVLVNDGDGRARPTVYTLGADTGRMSAVRPNIQQLPREGGFRSMFVADEGMTFISADFSSVEIRVAAALSQDPVLIRMLDEGLDPHTMAARIVYDIPEGTDVPKALRYKVKSGVFGRIYGGGVATLAAQMRVPQHIAQKLIDTIDSLWPTLSAWSRASTQAVERGLETTFTTYSGRVVHLPKKAAHAAGNYKIQGTARELLVDALMRWKQTKWGKAIMWPVHDELDVMVPIADAEEATLELVRCMETVLNGVRIIADPSAPSPQWQNAA